VLFSDLGRNSPFEWGAGLIAVALLLAFNLFRGLGEAPLTEAEPMSRAE